MASELLKNRALIQKLKEPEVPRVNFDLASTGFEELFTLPEPKPQELLNIQEDVRIQRQQDTMDKARPFLMDESVDFIEREEFADGPKTAAKKSLLKFLNPDYLKAKGPERSALLAKQRDRLGRLKKGTSAVLKDVDQTENFLKKFYEYSDKFFGGNRSRALTSLIPNYDPANRSILKNMRLRVGLPADEGSLAQRTKIKGLKEGLTFSEFRTKIAKEPDFLKKVTKGANVNKFYNTRDLFNLLGITTERGNPKAIEYFTGELKRAGIESRPNPAGGQGKQYKLKNVINFFKEKPKTMLGKTSRERTFERLKGLRELDKGLVDFNREVIKNVRETAIAEDVYIPKDTLGASAGDHIGHPVSVQVTNKPEFKNLLKDSNVNKMNSLVFQDAVVNMESLNKKTGYDTKFNTYFKQLNKFLNKPITEKDRAELIKIKNDMDNHYMKAVNTVSELAEKNEFFKGQQKRIPKVTINIPEVGSKFKSSDLFADMSTVDSEYRYGKVQDINPDAKFFKDLSDDQKQIFKQNIYNQYSDNLNSFYKAAKLPVEDVEEFSQFIEAGGVKETVGKKELIPTAEDSKNIAKQLASFGFKCSAAEGGACDNPMNYLDDIKKQQAIAKGSGNAAANAAKKLSAGKTILREFIGPAALTFELAAAVPLGYLSYKAGLPPSRIANQLTYGAFGDTETARLKKVAVKEGIDTRDIQKGLDFEKASGAMQTLAMQEQDFRGPDDEMLFPQQYEKGEEDFYKAVGAFRDEEGNISKDVFQTISDQLKKVRGIISEEDAARAAEREAKTDLRGIGDYLTEGVIPEEEQIILPVFDFQEPSTRMDFSEGGPNDPSRRTFLKFLAGIASLPFVGKFFKAAKAPKVVKLANTSTTMPEWFPAFVEKAFERGVVKKIDADIQTAELSELPGITITKHDDGRVFVQGENAYGKNYEVEYEPPGYVVIDEETGKAVRKKGEFIAQEEVPVNVDPDGNADFDVEVLDDLDQILGPDTRVMEEFATGKKVKDMKSGEFSVGKAEADADVARDLDDFYED
jgi:hypothetical protein